MNEDIGFLPNTMDSGFDFLKTFCIIKTSTFLTFGEERWHVNTDDSLYAWNFLQFDLYEYDLVEC